jgi:hypothetical protein
MNERQSPEELLQAMKPQSARTVDSVCIDQMIARALITPRKRWKVISNGLGRNQFYSRAMKLAVCASLIAIAILIPTEITAGGRSSGATITPTSPLCQIHQKASLMASHCYELPAGYLAAPKNDIRGPTSNPDPCGTAPPLGTTIAQVAGPFSPQQYDTSDAWFNETGTDFYHVFAGDLSDNAQQGVIVVQFGPLSGLCSSTVDWTLSSYPTSGSDGFLSITSSNGWILGLTAANGAKYYFDVASLTYISS